MVAAPLRVWSLASVIEAVIPIGGRPGFAVEVSCPLYVPVMDGLVVATTVLAS